MSHLSGITVKKNPSGKPTHLVINISKNPDLAEDILDVLEADKHAGDPGKPWEEVRAKLDKKHNIKR